MVLNLENIICKYAKHDLLETKCMLKLDLDWDGSELILALLLLQVLKKDSQEFVARSYWDVLRRSASQVLFSDLAEVHRSVVPSFLHFSSFVLFLHVVLLSCICFKRPHWSKESQSCCFLFGLKNKWNISFRIKA